MRIALVKAGEPVPDMQEGRTQRMGALAAELRSRGHEVVWYTNNVDRMTGEHLVERTRRFRTSDGIDMVVFSVPGFGSRTSPIRLFAQLLTAAKTAGALLRRRDLDVIVISYPYLESAFLCGLAARVTRTPTIVDVRDLFPDNYEGALAGLPSPARTVAIWPFRWMARQALRLATVRVAISEDFLRWIHESFSLLPRSSDEAIPLPSPRSTAGTAAVGPIASDKDPDEIRLLYVGSLNRIIDLRSVVLGLKHACSRVGARVRFVIAGDGERYADVEAAVGDAEWIELRGWLDPAAVEHELSIADWGVAPYEPARASGMGNKYFEYMRVGLPVLTSDAKIGAELADAGAGHFVDLASPAACAQSLVPILAGEERPDRNAVADYYESVLLGGRSELRFADLVEEVAHGSQRS